MQVADATWKQTYSGILSDEQVDYMYSVMYNPEKLKEQMENGTYFLIYAENEVPLAYCAYEFKSEAPDSSDGRMLKVIFVPKLYVRPDMQGKNIGKKLLQQIENIGAVNNCHFVELNVNRNNKALHFYEHLGFFVHQEVNIPIGKFFMNDYAMRKSIQFVTP